MGRTIKSKVKTSEVYFDEELYPRSNVDWQTAYVYSQSMVAGAKFPPIVLALFNNRKYLVDGKHRLDAYKLLKIEEADAIVHTGWSKKKIFEEAIRLNISHGRVLSPFDKRKIALRLREMNSTDKEISELIQVPQDKLEKFIGQRLISSISGQEITSEQIEQTSKEIGQAILKSGIKHLAGQILNPAEVYTIEENQKPFANRSQLNLLDEFISLLENKYLDLKDKRVIEKLTIIKSLLKGVNF